MGKKTAYLKQKYKYTPLSSRNLSCDWLPRLLLTQVLPKICCHCILPCLYPNISSGWFTGSVGASISMTNGLMDYHVMIQKVPINDLHRGTYCVDRHKGSLFWRTANSRLWSHSYLMHYESLWSTALEENLILETSVRVKYIASHCFLDCFLLFVPSCSLLKCALKRDKQLLVRK